jgi:hypothetical protein
MRISMRIPRYGRQIFFLTREPPRASAFAAAASRMIPPALVLADARPPALLAFAPPALVLADARPPALLACAPFAQVLADARAPHSLHLLP